MSFTGKSAERALLRGRVLRGVRRGGGGLKHTRRSCVRSLGVTRGAARRFEDLVQEGCLALLVLIPRCPDRRWLARYLKTNLPGYVRDAAARMRKTITNGGRDDDGGA